jgi:hypothetical protein
MTQPTSDPGRDENGVPGLGPIADALKRESERLRQLAEELKARAEADAEMRANYPNFKRAVYALLREQAERELPLPPDADLEALAVEEGGQPLEAFIGELEALAEDPGDAG